MSTNKKPSALNQYLALRLIGMTEQAEKVLIQAHEEMAHDIMAFVNSRDSVDMPIVASTLIIVGTSLKNFLSPEGKELVDVIVEHTSCITVDADSLYEQACSEDDTEE